MDEVHSKKKKVQNLNNSKQSLNVLFPIVPDPARLERTDGNHEQNEQHASGL